MVTKEGEKILFEVRRHWYVLAAEGGAVGLMTIIPFFVMAVAGTLDISDQTFFLILFASAAWIGTMCSVFFIIWTNYYLDVWIVTNQRIIDVEQYTLFSRDISEFRLDRIQNLTVEVRGPLATLLSFGDIYVETAGMARVLTIREVPDPYKIKDRIILEADKAIKKAHQHDHGGL